MSDESASMFQAAPGVHLPEAALSFSFSRSGGPGGQNVNKLNTRATLTINREVLEQALPAPAMARLEHAAARYMNQAGLQISSAEGRSQIANRRDCLEKLRAVLIEAMRRPKVRKRTRPSARAVQRRLDAKKQRGKLKATRRSGGRE